MIVLDASVALEVLLNTTRGRRLHARLFAEGESLHAPELLDLEVMQVLRRYVRTRRLDAERGREVLEDLAALPLSRYRHGALLERIWTLRANVTAYDAAYVALAEALQAPLLTADASLARIPGVQATVELV